MKTVTTLLEDGALRAALADEALREAVAEVQATIDEIIAAAMPKLRRLHGRVVDARAALIAVVGALGSSNFDQPRTHQIHGYTLGFRRGRDSLRIADEAVTIERIQTWGRTTQLTRTKVSIDMHALGKLSDADLAKVLVQRVPGDDDIVVTPKVDVMKGFAALIGDRLS